MWSAGVLLYFLVTGAYPFAGINDDIIKQKILKSDYQIPSKFYITYKCLLILIRGEDFKPGLPFTYWKAFKS